MGDCARTEPDPYKSGRTEFFYFIIFWEFVVCAFYGLTSTTDDTMSDDGEQFFEGVEKLLEIWFINSDGHEKNADLRRIPRSQWETLLKIVRCEIISFTKNEQIDAYVLSESSMFVSKRRFILKTCGTTTPLLCLQPLLLLVQQYAGFTEVEDLFYSRKNYKRPDLQVTPHKHFDQEVALLDTLFPDGVAYCLGAVNRDCWFLYTLNPMPQHRRSAMLSSGAESDETLEILMTDLDPEIMAIFTKEECLNATEATKKAGIDKIIPNMTIDDFLFEPCGYSMNGVSKNVSYDVPEGCYMTIHITPEPEFSYVSFETNVPASNYKEIITKVLDTFMPGKFTVTVFTNQMTAVKDTPKDLLCLNQINNKWNRRDVQQISFKNYDLIYAFYTKFPS